MELHPAAKPERRRQRVLALSIGVVLTLALAELAVRALDVPPTPLEPLFVPNYRLSDDPLLGYEYRPSYGGEGEGFDAPHRTIRTNAHGFRDRELPLAKPPGTIRVIAFGDSTTAGNCVDDFEDVYPKVLERLLAQRADGTRYEVLNQGVGGYHTRQEIRMLETKGLAFEPDVVTVMFCVNDYYPAADGDVKERLQAASAHLAPMSEKGSLLGAVLQRSRLAFCVYHRVRNLVDAWGDPVFARDESLVEEALHRLSELQREHGFRALVFILPAFKDPWSAYRHQEDHDRLLAIGARIDDLEVIDLLPDFAALGPDPEPFACDGLHPNEAGHAVLAEMVAHHLERMGLVRPAGTASGMESGR